MAASTRKSASEIVTQENPEEEAEKRWESEKLGIGVAMSKGESLGFDMATGQRSLNTVRCGIIRP